MWYDKSRLGGTYINNKLNGIYKEYWFNGQLYVIINYENNKKMGVYYVHGMQED